MSRYNFSRVTISIPKSLAAQIDGLAQHENRSRSNMITALLSRILRAEFHPKR